jgi:hypothetical protein
MHNLFLVYFVNLYMFRAYLGPSSGGTTVCSSNLNRTTDSHLQRTISTNCCIHTVVPPHDEPGYAQNMSRLTKYTKNKLCIKLVFLYFIINGLSWPQNVVNFCDCHKIEYMFFQSGVLFEDLITVTPMCRWKDNTTMDLKSIGRAWTGLIWLRMRTSCCVCCESGN